MIPKGAANGYALLSDANGVGSWTSFSAMTLALTDSLFTILDDGDPTKIAQFQLSGLTTGTTRTYALQDVSGTLLTDSAPASIFANWVIQGTDTVTADLEIKTTTWFLLRNGANDHWNFQFLDNGCMNMLANGSGIVFFTGSNASGYTGNFLALKNGTSSAANKFITLPWQTGTVSLLEFAQTWTALQTFRDTTWKVVGDADASKTFVLSLGGASANADCVLAWAGTADRTITLPDATGTLALTTDVDTARTWSTLQKFKDTTFLVGDDGDITKALQFSLGGATAAKTLTLASAHTLDRTLTFPNETGTLLSTVSSPTLTGSWIWTSAADATAMRLNTDSDAMTANVFEVYDTFESKLKAACSSSGILKTAGFQFFSGEVDVGNNGQFGLPAITSNRQYNFPDASGTVLLDTTGIALLGTNTIDMKTAATTTIFTTQSGKVTRISHAVVRDATASLAGGTSYTITGLRAAFSLAALVTANTGFVVVRSADLAEQAEVAASTAVQLTVTTGSTAAANATIDVFGYVL